MNRRELLAAAGLGAASATLSRLAAAEERRSRPNVLFILADDFRADCIGALGNPHIKTPNLDALVQRGVVFSRAYCMGAMIGAVCLPSRTMIQTGRSLFRLPGSNARAPLPRFLEEMKDKQEGKDWVLLPRVLSASAIETFHIGKSGNECIPAIQSYEHNIVCDDRSEDERRESSQRHADQVIEFLRGRKRERPFFIYMAPPVPHDPRVAPKEFMDLYDPEKIPLPPAYLPQHPFDNGEMTVRDEQLAPWPRTPAIVRRHLADYYACVTCLDHHIGRILECLNDLGQLDNTVVIFSGDNGLSIGDHGLMGKQNLYEFGGMHVPLVIAGPDIPHGKSDAFVYLFDLFPTICELAGVEIPTLVEGKSLAPVIRGEKKNVRDCIFTAYRTCQRAVRTDRWKIIRYPEVDRTQLFDLQNDPHERKNLSDVSDRSDPSDYAQKVKELTGLLEKMQKEFADTAPLTVSSPKPAAWTAPEGSDKPARKGKKQ